MSAMFLTALLSTTPAHALSCGDLDIADVHPSDGATEVPVNVVPVVRTYNYGSPEWVLDNLVVRLTDTGSGAEIAVEIEAIEEDGPSLKTWLLHPEAELSPDTLFTLEISSAQENGWERAFSFSTSAEIDLDAPEPATADSLIYDRDDDDWGSWRSLTVDLEGGDDHPGNWWRIEMADNADFEGAQVRASLSQPARYFHGPCDDDAVAADEPGETWVRVTTVDAAGNEAEPQVVHFDGPTGGTGAGSTGCSTVSSRPGPLAAIAGLLGLVAVGRRRR